MPQSWLFSRPGCGVPLFWNAQNAALASIIVIVKILVQEPDSFIVLSLAGVSLAFSIAASLVRRQERRNEPTQLDEFLRDPLVSDKYVRHYFVAISLILTISAILAFYIEWTIGLVVAFPATVFGYLAYVYR